MPRLPCPDELWPEFSALLDQALDMPPAKRAGWLASLGAEHAAVLPWLSKVIAADGNVDPTFMQFPRGSDSDFHTGQLVGAYRLERCLGTGGMGEVWLAARDDGTLSRRVALKLPYRYLFADALRRRFERERDILAALSHPHIALLYDAGVDEREHPYLAMEWVDGVSLTAYCTDNRLGLYERIALFLQILDAVQYAHARLVAHRDLKPSNILVTTDGNAKLLDFGIAKLLDTTLEGATELTQAGTRLATPEYAAPEQLTSEPLTVAVDIFSLGVVFYELLTGGRPFPRRAANVQYGPPRASANIRPDHAANVGNWSLGQLRRALRGDLDAILGKALEWKPANRYLSAQSFATDIQNTLSHRPISARRIGPGLLATRFVRRHWLGATMSAALLLALVGGSIGVAWQALRVEQEAKRTLTIKNFLVDVFRASDPRIAEDKPRGQITARELLDISADRIESSFSREPATEIELLGVTADIYRELDETSRSSAMYSR
jgi:serine/threonine protein kinase